MTDFFRYFSIFVFALSVIYILVRFFDESKLTDILIKWYKKYIERDSEKPPENAEAVSAEITETEGEPVEKIEETKSKSSEIFDNIRNFYNEKKQLINKSISDDVKLFIKIALIVLITRVIIYIFGYFSVMADRGASAAFENIWIRADAQHYLRLAQEWYTKESEVLIVFMPLFPLLIMILKLFIGNYFWSAIILSNLALMVGCFYMYKLFQFEYDDKIAFNGVKYLLFFPASFFLCVPYTESLFIMLSVMMFYYLRKEKYLLSAILGMLAATTRLHGVLLFIPFIIEIFVQRNVFGNLYEKKIKTAAKDVLIKGAMSLLIPFGLGLYLYLNKALTGDWFRFIYWQEKNWISVFKVFFEKGGSIDTIIAYASRGASIETAGLWVPEIVAVLLAFLIIIYAIKIKMRVSYFAYFSAYIFMAISISWLLSAPRYIMAGFPIYLATAHLGKKKYADLLITFFSVLALMYLIYCYVNGKKVY